MKNFYFPLGYVLVLVFAACSFVSYSQLNNFQKDLQFYQKVLQDHHPSLYEYVEKSDLDSLYLLALQKCDTISDQTAFAKLVTEYTARIGCGHTRVLLQQFLTEHLTESDTCFLPLPLLVRDSSLIASVNNFNIPVNSEIISINGVCIKTIIEKGQNLISADANNKGYKQYKLQEFLFLYLYFILGRNDQFIIKYNDSEEKRLNNLSVLATNYRVAFEETVKSRIAHFPELGKGAISGELLNDSTYLLTVNTFDIPKNERESFILGLDGLFTSLKEKKLDKLIIDVQHNQGGARDLAARLYSYLTETQFTQRDSAKINTSIIDTNNLIFPKDANTLMQYLEKTYGKQKLEIEDHLSPLMNPKINRFDGNVIVLIGPGTFSAGAEFALNCKINNNITLMGAETGGNATFHNGDIILVYRLPFTGIQVKIPIVRIFHNRAENENNRKRGIQPDIKGYELQNRP